MSIDATKLMSFLSQQKKLISHYSSFNCGDFFVNKYCSGINWSKIK